MYSKLEEFLSDWCYEEKCTRELFESLTDESLTAKAWHDGRTIGFLACHIGSSVAEMLKTAGLELDGSVVEENNEPISVKQILDIWNTNCNLLNAALREKWNDEKLAQDVEMYGEVWTYGGVLKSLLLHTVHHRGQLTVMMRIAGLKFKGIYGPTYEEWAQWNMPPAK